MVRITTSTAILLALPAAAFAGPADVPPPLPPVIVPVEEPFEGFYVGLEYGHAFGDITVTEQGDPPETFDIDNESTYGLFAGYNVQNGALIYGAELRYLVVDMDPDPDFPNVFIEDIVDIRARLGYALGERAMVYGAVGYSMVGGNSSPGALDLTGYNYGLGAEYNVSDSFFVGVDYTGRELEDSIPGFDFEASVNTLTLRAGLRF